MSFPPLSNLVSEKFINFLVVDGKKMKARKVFLETLEILAQKARTVSSPLSPSAIVEQALHHCMPSVEVRKVRVAGTTYLVPAMISKKKQETLAIRWILEAARKKKHTSRGGFAHCLAEEVFDAFLQQGTARTKRNELHRLAEANRAYVRYRWW